MTAKNSPTNGPAPAIDGVGPDATTAVPNPPEVEGAVVDTQPELRDDAAKSARLQQLAAMAVGTEDARPIVRDGQPVYPGPMDRPLPEVEGQDVVDHGGTKKAQVLFNLWRTRRNGVTIESRRGDVIKVTAEQLSRGVELGGLKALE